MLKVIAKAVSYDYICTLIFQILKVAFIIVLNFTEHSETGYLIPVPDAQMHRLRTHEGKTPNSLRPKFKSQSPKKLGSGFKVFLWK